MDEMLKKQDVLDAIYATMEKTDKPDVVLGLAAAMSVVNKMEGEPVNPQEPCDCTSRADAIKALEYSLSIEADGGLDKYRTVIKDLLNTIYNTQKKAIEDLPSIQPKPKTGHWTDYQDDRWIYAKCSECGTVHDTRTNYCPNCGAKMGGEE